MIRLYGYWRSSAAYRVRIALNVKGLEYENVSVNLAAGTAEQHRGEYAAVNPQRRVPTLVDGPVTIGQSVAILEYLEEKYTEPRILPVDPAERAFARQVANIVACDIHPLNNVSVLQYLAGELGAGEDARNAWYRHWVQAGFHAVESLLARRNGAGPYCLGAGVTLADICLVPQMYNAHRFSVPLDKYPVLRAVEAACLALDPFRRAIPENQPDAPKQS